MRTLECEKPRGMALQGSRLLLAFYDKTLEERDLDGQGMPPVRVHHVGNTVACMAASFEREEVAVGTFVKLTKLLELGSGREKQTLQGHFAPVLTVALSEHHLATASSDHILLVYDRRTGESNALFAFEKKITSLLFWGDHRLVSGSENGKLVLWNLDAMDSEAIVHLAGEAVINDLHAVNDRLFVSSSTVLLVLALPSLETLARFDLPSSSLTSSHGLVIVAGEHLNPVTVDTLRLRPCLCCHSSHAGVLAIRPRSFALVRASDRFLVASDWGQTVVYDFAPR